MSLAAIVFYIFAGLIVISALVIFFTKNIFHAAFSLLGTFLGVAAVYVFAGADFVAVTQIVVYVGGILILLVFGIMLTNRISSESIQTPTHNRFWGVLLGGSTFVLFVYMIFKANFIALARTPEPISQTVKTIGIGLMSDYLLPFEIAALLLLVALIGASFIARNKIEDKP